MQNVCKKQLIKQRQQRRKISKPVQFIQDPDDARTIRLLNGQELRRPFPDVPLYINKLGWVYSLTRFGLRRLRTDFWKKNNYCKRTCSGNAQGQIYPYVNFQNVTYRIHRLMAYAWLRPCGDDETIDHINGDIDNNRLVNLRIITKAENYRCGGILRRLRNASRRLNDPSLDPVNISQERLLQIYDSVDPVEAAAIMDWELRHHMEI